MSKPIVIYFRPGGPESDAELTAARRQFSVVTCRDDIPPDTTVLCRYSALPFAEELEAFLKNQGCDMIVPVRDQALLSNIGKWYPIVGHRTFTTWSALDLIPDHAFPIVIKGATNSRKHEWEEKMFARDRQEAHRIVRNLSDDPLIEKQRLYFRKFEELRKIAKRAAGLVPFSDEHRVFLMGGRLIAAGFYWSETHEFTINPSDSHDTDICKLASEVANRFLQHGVQFLVVDIARLANGELRVVEVGDPQMAGLSTIDPDAFYMELWLGLSGRS